MVPGATNPHSFAISPSALKLSEPRRSSCHRCREALQRGRAGRAESQPGVDAEVRIRLTQLLSAGVFRSVVEGLVCDAPRGGHTWDEVSVRIELFVLLFSFSTHHEFVTLLYSLIAR